MGEKSGASTCSACSKTKASAIVQLDALFVQLAVGDIHYPSRVFDFVGTFLFGSPGVVVWGVAWAEVDTTWSGIGVAWSEGDRC